MLFYVSSTKISTHCVGSQDRLKASCEHEVLARVHFAGHFLFLAYADQAVDIFEVGDIECLKRYFPYYQGVNNELLSFFVP